MPVTKTSVSRSMSTSTAARHSLIGERGRRSASLARGKGRGRLLSGLVAEAAVLERRVFRPVQTLPTVPPQVLWTACCGGTALDDRVLMLGHRQRPPLLLLPRSSSALSAALASSLVRPIWGLWAAWRLPVMAQEALRFGLLARLALTRTQLVSPPRRRLWRSSRRETVCSARVGETPASSSFSHSAVRSSSRVMERQSSAQRS